jgi:squalene/phytoene synthase
MDMTTAEYDEPTYRRYIYGSAEVVGLMCLKVFVEGDAAQYEQLRDGASHLGAAYQKVNFLRDMKADHEVLGRMYFPGVDYPSFSDASKRTIEADIAADFAIAKASVQQLPSTARRAVHTSVIYYEALFQRLQNASAADLKARRIRVPNSVKSVLFARGAVGL